MAPGKSLLIKVAPADPSTAAVAVHVNGLNCARIRIGTELVIVAPHFEMANANALSRCCPNVVPVLPPTGTAGVGSLNPTPAALTFRMFIVAAADAVMLARTQVAPISAR